MAFFFSELAVKSPDLTSMEKLCFIKKKLELMQEFGDVSKYREATEQLKKYKSLNAAQIKLEAKKRKELAKEELRLKEIEELRAQTRAQANLKAKMAESEGRLLVIYFRFLYTKWCFISFKTKPKTNADLNYFPSDVTFIYHNIHLFPDDVTLGFITSLASFASFSKNKRIKKMKAKRAMIYF